MGRGASDQVTGGPPDIIDLVEADGKVIEGLIRLSHGCRKSATQFEGLLVGLGASGQITGGPPDIADLVEADPGLFA